MSRDERHYLEDILAGCDKILASVNETNFDEVRGQALVYDGIVFNLLTIGEAVKHISQGARDQHSEIPWRKIAGLRDIIAHGYFGIDDDVIRDVVTHQLIPLRVAVQTLLG